MNTHYFTIIAQTALPDGLGKVVSIIQAISMVLFFGSLVISGMLFALGKVEYIKFGLVGSAVGGLAWTIIIAMFGVTGEAPQIQLQPF